MSSKCYEEIIYCTGYLVSGVDLEGGKLEREVVRKTRKISGREGEEWNSPILC